MNTEAVLTAEAARHPEAAVRPFDALPGKADLFGVEVSLVDRAQTLEQIMTWARDRRPALVDFMGVCGLTLAHRDPDFRRCLNQFDLIACDGQPVRWALNRWYGAGIPHRVDGTTMTLDVCEAAAAEGVPVYFYGSRVEVLDQLTERLGEYFPRLEIVGAEAPLSRPISRLERGATVNRINGSGAGIVFLGLGCPNEEIFAAAVRDRLQAVQLCVGAAFELHAGLAPMAPPWMQDAGLEWFFRMCREPRRLWRRYLVDNSQFARMCLTRIVREVHWS